MSKKLGGCCERNASLWTGNGRAALSQDTEQSPWCQISQDFSSKCNVCKLKLTVGQWRVRKSNKCWHFFKAVVDRRPCLTDWTVKSSPSQSNTNTVRFMLTGSSDSQSPTEIIVSHSGLLSSIMPEHLRKFEYFGNISHDDDGLPLKHFIGLQTFMIPRWWIQPTVTIPSPYLSGHR